MTLFVMLLAAIAPRSMRPVWTGRVAGYRLVKWSHPDPEENSAETLYLEDSKGRVVTAVHDARVSPLWPESGDRIEAEDVDGDGVPEVVLMGWSGGAHGSNVYYVWSLGRHPRCLLAYDKNNVSDEHDFDLVDLDGDGVKEVRSWYDGYAYTVGGSYWPNLPVVLRLEHGRYVDRTTHYPRILRRAARAAWEELDSHLYPGDLPSWEGPGSPAITLLALGDLLGTRSQVWRRLEHTLSNANVRWLRRHEPEILAIIRGRTRRYAYPKAYDPRPIRIAPFPDPTVWRAIKS